MRLPLGRWCQLFSRGRVQYQRQYTNMKLSDMSTPLRLVQNLPSRWRNLLGLVAAILLLATLYSLHYIYAKTPLPVYALDKLNVRPYFLPDLHCNHCNNFTVNYLVHEEAKCGLDEDVFLLIFLISYAPNVRERKIVRESWGGVKKYRGFAVKTLFVFGVHSDKNFNKQLVYEQEKHSDIVQGNFTDDYHHLTEKTMMALSWISKHCSQAKYILKTDDDSFNHPHRIIDYLMTVKEANFVGGYCFTVMPDRRISSKYYIPESVYPDRYYPTYCAGPGYILSQGAIAGILRVAPDVIYLPMEDVYVAGMCRETANIPYTNIQGMIISQDQMHKCDLATWAMNAHNIVPEIQAVLWARAMEAVAMRDCLSSRLPLFAVVAAFLAFWIRTLFCIFRGNDKTRPPLKQVA